MKKKNKNIKEKYFSKKQIFKLIVCIIILLIIFTLYFLFQNKSYLKLKVKGYGNSTIIIINDKLKEKDINVLLKTKKVDNIEYYLTHRNFKMKNLERYIDYKKKNKDLNYDQIIIYVNMNLDKKAYSEIQNAKIKNNLTLVNKYFTLSKYYIPDELKSIDKEFATKEDILLTKEAKTAFESLCKDAKSKNLNILAYSGYRSYTYQTYTYNSYGRKYGNDKADSYSARSGHSEHQLGLAVDVTNAAKEMNHFENTKEYEWLKNNAYKYGFILRYQKNNENITQYIFEPWHYRYVGVKIATDMYKNFPSLSYDEYYYKFID